LVDSSSEAYQNSPLTDVRIRQAINYGFNRKKMMKYLRNNLGVAANHGFVPFGLPLFDPSKIDGYYFNPDTARILLEDAGFPLGEGLEEIKLTTTSDYLDLCEFIQFELSKLGIQLDIEVATGGSFRNKVANSNLLFFRGSWIADYPDAENYLSLFYSQNFSPEGPNYTHFSNAEFDALYVQASETRDDSLRAGLYHRMDQIVIDQAPVVPLYYDEVIRFVPLNITGLGINPMNLLVLKSVKKRHYRGE